MAELPVTTNLNELLRLADEARLRVENSSHVAILDKAIELWRRALEHPDFDTLLQDQKASVFNNAAMTFYFHYQGRGSTTSLERAIDLVEQASKLMPERPVDQSAVLSNLSSIVRARFERYGHEADLQLAVQAARQAVDILPGDSPERINYANALIGALYEQYNHTGNLDNLDQAIAVAADVLAATAEDAPQGALRSSNLGVLLQERYNRLGRIDDLQKAIDTHRKALERTSAESPQIASLLNNFGGSLLDLYRRTGDVDNLQKAIEACRLAVQLAPEDSPNRAGFFNNLSNALYAYYQRNADVESLQTAADAQRLAVGATPNMSAQRASFLSGLGTILTESFTRSGIRQDIDEAIDVCQEAINLTPINSHKLASRLNNLARSMRERYCRFGHPDDLPVAQSAYRRACERALEAQMEVAIVAGYNWGSWAVQREAWSEAIEALGYALQATDLLFRAELLRANKEAWLREAQVLPALMAYALAQLGRCGEAVTVLEKGRARLLVEAIERERADLQRLTSIGYELVYERYRRATEQMLPFEQVSARSESASYYAQRIVKRHAAQTELNEAVAAIGQIAGYEDFFKDFELDRIQLALTSAQPDTIGVYLSVSPAGSMALIVSHTGVQPVWLPWADHELDRILVGISPNDGSGYLAAQLDYAPLGPALDRILQILGAKIVQPLIELLARSPVVPRTIILIPTGRLNGLPLHAAPYLSPMQNNTCTLLDEFIVSYAPAARVLDRAHHTLKVNTHRSSIWLGVGNPLPLPEGIEPLVFSQFEVEEVADFFDDQSKLIGTACTLTAVSENLSCATYLHFACHGRFDPLHPLDSGMLLSDGEYLKLGKLLEHPPLDNVRLVVLSACQTALSDFARLPDESIGLPAGWLQIGVPGVVGSLWAVNDLSTALLMIKFYAHHLKDKQSPAQALRCAQLWLRDVTNAELSELFDVYRRSASDATTSMAYATAQQKFRDHTLAVSDARPFEHPYYWAAFAFYGV